MTNREAKTRAAGLSGRVYLHIDAFHVAEIERLCGDDAYFVCITRHGLDVACSMRDWCERSEVYLEDLHRYVARHPRLLEAFTHAWVDSTTAIAGFADRHPDNAIQVRYEDLVADPDVQVRKIVEFVGEPWDDGMRGAMVGLHLVCVKMLLGRVFISQVGFVGPLQEIC